MKSQEGWEKAMFFSLQSIYLQVKPDKQWSKHLSFIFLLGDIVARGGMTS